MLVAPNFSDAAPAQEQPLPIPKQPPTPVQPAAVAAEPIAAQPQPSVPAPAASTPDKKKAGKGKAAANAADGIPASAQPAPVLLPPSKPSQPVHDLTHLNSDQMAYAKIWQELERNMRERDEAAFGNGAAAAQQPTAGKPTHTEPHHHQRYAWNVWQISIPSSPDHNSGGKRGK